MVQNLNVFEFKMAIFGIEKSYVQIQVELCVAKSMEAPHISKEIYCVLPLHRRK